MRRIGLLTGLLMLFELSIVSGQNYSDYTEINKELVFYDDFDEANISGWPIGETSSTKRVFVPPHELRFYSTYAIANKIETPLFTAIPVNIDENRDFEIEVEISMYKTKTPTNGGIIWGSNGNDMNTFLYSGKNKKYSIDIKKSHQNKKLVDNFEKNIKVGAYRKNKLTIRKIKAKYYFFINENFVDSISYESFFGNHIGFYCGSKTVVYATYFKISYLKDNQKFSKSLIEAEYDRSSLSFVVSDNPETSDYSDWFTDAVVNQKTTDKYYNINTSVRNVQSENILGNLNSSKIGNEIIANWWARDNSGIFSLDTLKTRGMYNATDENLLYALSTERGVQTILDDADMLINKSYVAVFLLDRCNTEAEEAAKTDDFVRQLMDLDGLHIKLTLYLFKVDFSDKEKQIFYDNMWIYSSDSYEQKKQKKQQYENYNFPLKFIDKVTVLDKYTALKIRNIPEKKIFYDLIYILKREALDIISAKYKDFSVKTALYSTNPLTAKIGYKEGLLAEDRFLVVENAINENGEIAKQQVGVVRATKKIADNRQVTTGQSPVTLFKQTAGQPLSEGMQLIQSKRRSNRLGIGYSTILNAPTINMEFSLSSFAYRKRVRKKRRDPNRQYLLPAYTNLWAIFFYAENIGRATYQIGFNRDFFIKNYYIAPIFGVGVVANGITDKAAAGLIYGAKIGYNLPRKNINKEKDRIQLNIIPQYFSLGEPSHFVTNIGIVFQLGRN
jgi:hypothetical protein